MPQSAIQPTNMARPTGQYSHGIRASGTFLFIAGQVAMNANGQVVGPGDVGVQCEQIFQNLSSILDAAGATFANLVKMNFYITDMQGIEVVRPIRSRYLGDSRPASTFVGVTALANPQYLLEIEAVAVLD